MKLLLCAYGRRNSNACGVEIKDGTSRYLTKRMKYIRSRNEYGILSETVTLYLEVAEEYIEVTRRLFKPNIKKTIVKQRWVHEGNLHIDYSDEPLETIVECE